MWFARLLWNRNVLSRLLSVHDAMAWIIRFCVDLWGPYQLGRVLLWKQEVDIPGAEIFYNTHAFFRDLALSGYTVDVFDLWS